MTSAERITLLRRHGLGLLGIVLAYLLITILRSLRADFAPEIWGGLGHASQPAVFTQSELWVTLVVVISNGALVLVKDNRRAFFTGLLLSIAGLSLGLLALWAHHQSILSPFAFMVLLGVGMYVPYVARIPPSSSDSSPSLASVGILVSSCISPMPSAISATSA
jgi:hypothetical protein